MATTTTMTATMTTPPKSITIQPRPKPKLSCFSFAAYAKNLIDNLIADDIPVLEGLTDVEFTSIESLFSFTFPPDLRSILQTGLPVGPGFPNWRSSSPEQLQILTRLPSRTLLKAVSTHGFWCDSWSKGVRPVDSDEAVEYVRECLACAPVLVPVYRDCYIPANPNMAGNPVFYIKGCDFKILSYDLDGFFREVEFLKMGIVLSAGLSMRMSASSSSSSSRDGRPAWAATEPRRIDFWSDVVEKGRRVVARESTRGWWWCVQGAGSELGLLLEEAFWRLRDGGWDEEDVRDMMAMDGRDESKRNPSKAKMVNALALEDHPISHF